MDIKNFFGNKEEKLLEVPNYISSSDEEEEENPYTLKYILSKIIMEDYKPVKYKDPGFTSLTSLRKHINYKLDIEKPAVELKFTDKYLNDLLKGLGFKQVKSVKLWNMELKH